MSTHSSVFAWEIPWTEGPGGSSLWGCKEPDMAEYGRTYTVKENMPHSWSEVLPSGYSGGGFHFVLI